MTLRLSSRSCSYVGVTETLNPAYKMHCPFPLGVPVALGSVEFVDGLGVGECGRGETRKA